MVSNKKIVLAIPLIILIFLSVFTGCTSIMRPKINGSSVKKADYESPANSVIAFGFIFKSTNGSPVNATPIPDLEFVQINPDVEPMFVVFGQAGNDYGMNFSPPVSPGSSFKVVSWTVETGIEYYKSNDNYYGIPVYGKVYPEFDQSLIITTSKPGLYYYGSYILHNDGKKFSIDNRKTELDALKLLAGRFKDPPWNQVIAERISQLESGKTGEAKK